ncbi:hypothetical protein ZIOFF_022327 [Zingiber officinale]|uniref:Uncharacterized protein n=1 Tax=Zingiber officinale TaxID=94328 RepID=A0A8J5H1E8_ZINOF|nr:hypothetical protein ZIOFF_022327 [Zingiber officinale]
MFERSRSTEFVDRPQLKDVGIISGLNVMRIINEPTVAVKLKDPHVVYLVEEESTHSAILHGMVLDLVLDHSFSKLMEKCLKDAKMNNSSIHDVVLADESMKILKVQQLLVDFADLVPNDFPRAIT